MSVHGDELSTRTFGNEDALPRVPLPALEDSCDRFLEWCAPLLQEGELVRTREAVAEFRAAGSPAWTLQAELERYASTAGTRSWLDEFWPYRYLGRRDRIAGNANFFFLLADTGREQLPRAASLVAAAVAYKLAVDEQRLPPAVRRGQPMSMEQNKYLFSATRIPGVEQDTARTPYTESWPGPSLQRHIVVFCRGTPYRVDVLDEHGAPYTEEAIADGLRAVQRAAAGRGPAVGNLTTQARAEWARTRQQLLDLDPRNAAALDAVETALLCLCLEDTDPADTLGRCRALLYGDSGNRWFDKALSFVVFPDGGAGVNVEHCNLDGTTILTLVDAMYEGVPDPDRPAAQGFPAVAELEFVLDDALRGQVRAAGEDFARFAADAASTLVSFDDFGTEHAKALRISPDAFVQLAYQLAHARAKGHVGATYESIATRQYHHGRTEAMRVVTPEMLRFVAAMDDPGAGPEARLGALRAAADAHVRRAQQCQEVEAPEQHLWELALIQRLRGEQLGAAEPLALYDSPGWLRMRDDYLSTSSAPSTRIQYFGFGSTSPHCIGVAYVLLPGRLAVHLSTPRSVAGQMHEFAAALRAAVGELRDLLAGD